MYLAFCEVQPFYRFKKGGMLYVQKFIMMNASNDNMPQRLGIDQATRCQYPDGIQSSSTTPVEYDANASRRGSQEH